MKLILSICTIAMVTAAPPPSTTNSREKADNVAAPSPNMASSTEKPDNVQLLTFENDDLGLGNYKFEFEQSDGTKREEAGEIKNQGSENEYLDVKGSFTWVGPDGVAYTVTYTANDNGFRPMIDQGPGGAVPSAVLASMTG